MEDQCDVIGFRESLGTSRGANLSRTGELESTRTKCRQRCELEHADAELGRYTECRRLAPALNDQGLRVEVRNVELEFLRPIGRVERSSCRPSSRGEKRDCHLRSIWQDDRYAVATTEPRIVKY